jgi:hypothetical protein
VFAEHPQGFANIALRHIGLVKHLNDHFSGTPSNAHSSSCSLPVGELNSLEISQNSSSKSHKVNKSEIRISKSETISNVQNSNF